MRALKNIYHCAEKMLTFDNLEPHVCFQKVIVTVEMTFIFHHVKLPSSFFYCRIFLLQNKKYLLVMCQV